MSVTFKYEQLIKTSDIHIDDVFVDFDGKGMLMSHLGIKGNTFFIPPFSIHSAFHFTTDHLSWNKV